RWPSAARRRHRASRAAPAAQPPGPAPRTLPAAGPRRHGAADRSARRPPYTRSLMRIVSLLPSATEIVCALGLRDELVGVTHECDCPPEVVGLPVMTRNALDLVGASGREIHRRVGDAVHG